MPCTVSNEDARYYEIATNTKKFGRRVTDVAIATEAACRACKLLEEHGAMGSADSFLKKWRANHQEEDTQRLIDERRRKNAKADEAAAKAFIAKRRKDRGE